ncbi:MAG: 3-methyladenine DNA glycosylase 2 [Synergistaceae bacterium]|nr:AlkA N-terminal domain-containing protein [Synergistota bacterium]NLM70518.1 3-methyladenine DNA glycosylase 2 [Synergistaceae bacterium]
MRVLELSPGLPSDPVHDTVRRAAVFFEESCFAETCTLDVLPRLRISEEALDLAFERAFGLPAGLYVQRQRDLYRDAAKSLSGGDRGTLYLRYRPPYRWEWMYKFLADRAIPGAEAAIDGEYMRTAHFRTAATEHSGWISVRDDPDNDRLEVTVSSSLLPVLPRVISRLRGLFDTDCDPELVYKKLSVMNDLREGLCDPGARAPGCFDPFETAVRTILGQQITVKAARTLAARIVDSFGGYVRAPAHGLERTFPGPDTFLEMSDSIGDRLGGLGVTGARSKSIRSIAESVTNGMIRLSRDADFAEEEKKLLELPGVGPWTANCLGMRVFGLSDAFPHTDLGVRKALEGMSNKEILSLGEAWRPWRSYAVINLWNSRS